MTNCEANEMHCLPERGPPLESTAEVGSTLLSKLLRFLSPLLGRFRRLGLGIVNLLLKFISSDLVMIPGELLGVGKSDRVTNDGDDLGRPLAVEEESVREVQILQGNRTGYRGVNGGCRIAGVWFQG